MTDVKFLIELGATIRKLRNRKGISQNELAGNCGLDKANISRIESGKINVTVLTLKKISKELSVSISDLCNGR